VLPLLIRSSKILIQIYSKKKVSDGGECAWPCYGTQAVEQQWDRESARGEVKSSGSIWLSLCSCWERKFQKGWCWMFLWVLLRIRILSRTAPRYMNQVIAKNWPRIKLLCSPWLLSCLVKKTESSSLNPLLVYARKKIRLTKFIKKAERSCLSCLKGWRGVFAGASYLLGGTIV